MDEREQRRFIANVLEARENGCDDVCAECGTGIAADGLEMHERDCSRRVDHSVVVSP